MTKTPPESAGAEVATGAAEVATEAAEVGLPVEPLEGLPHDAPVGAARSVDVAVPRSSRESPGTGKTTSLLSTLVQPFPILATNMSGSALKAAVSRSKIMVALRASSSSSRLDVPAVIVIGAQFIYISRFPILLNQVQAKTAVPVGREDGTVKE